MCMCWRYCAFSKLATQVQSEKRKCRAVDKSSYATLICPLGLQLVYIVTAPYNVMWFLALSLQTWQVLAKYV